MAKVRTTPRGVISSDSITICNFPGTISISSAPPWGEAARAGTMQESAIIRARDRARSFFVAFMNSTPFLFLILFYNSNVYV